MSTVQYRMNSAKFRKVKSGQTLDVTFDEITTLDGGEVIIVPVARMGAKVVHQDLINAAMLLVPHLLILSETKSAKDFSKSYMESSEALADTSVISKSHAVYGIHIKEKSEKRFAVLLGRKTVTNGRGYNIPLWPQSLEDDDDNKYIYTEQLKKGVDTFLKEVEAYLAGKWAPNAQTNLQKELDNTLKHPAAEQAEKNAEAAKTASKTKPKGTAVAVNA